LGFSNFIAVDTGIILALVIFANIGVKKKFSTEIDLLVKIRIVEYGSASISADLDLNSEA
jgi:hypothetical protein